MPLTPFYDSASDIPEGLSELYIERPDGRFQLDVATSNGWELSDTSALKNALSKERAAAQEAQKRLRNFEGIDPNSAREAMSKMEEIANFNPEQKVEEALKAREKQIFARHQSEMDVSKRETEALRTQLSDTLVTSAAAKAIAGAKGSVDLLLPHVLTSTRMRQSENGQFLVEVVDREGNPRIGDAQGNPMTIPQLVDEMRASDVFARAFEPTGATGSGTTSSNGTGSVTPNIGAKKTISRSDSRAIGQNLEAIASGEIRVVD
jgi:hypothetical protein